MPSSAPPRAACRSFSSSHTAASLAAKTPRSDDGRASGPAKTSVVLLATPQDVLDKMAYVIANPTAAGLVRAPDIWPGLITRRIGETLTFDAPDHFFDEDDLDDDEITLEFVRPAIFPRLTDSELNQKLFDYVAERVREARAKMLAEGKRFLGVQGVLRQPFSAKPETAASNASVRVAAIRALQHFLTEYREARLAWREGQHDVVFPLGTYALRLGARVRCVELCSS